MVVVAENESLIIISGRRERGERDELAESALAVTGEKARRWCDFKGLRGVEVYLYRYHLLCVINCGAAREMLARLYSSPVAFICCAQLPWTSIFEFETYSHRFNYRRAKFLRIFLFEVGQFLCDDALQFVEHIIFNKAIPPSKLVAFFFFCKPTKLDGVWTSGWRRIWEQEKTIC